MDPLLLPLVLMFVAYWVFSWILFCFPTLVHPYRRHSILPIREALAGLRILKVAHRGGPRHGTQNTIQSFSRALSYVDMLEMDICQTKDGVLVVHHDHDLQRTCGVKKFIRDHNLSDLPPFKRQIELNFAPKQCFSDTKQETIPTLEAVFKKFPQVPMNIELKTPSSEAIQTLLKLLKQYNRRPITIIGIRGKMQDQLRVKDLKTQRFMNDRDFWKYFLAYITGWLPFLYVEEASIQLPLYTYEYYQWKLREFNGAWWVHPWFGILRVLNWVFRPLLWHMKRRGVLPMYWVCNGEREVIRAVNMGARSVMSDDVQMLARVIDEKFPVIARAEEELDIFKVKESKEIKKSDEEDAENANLKDQENDHKKID